jgi:ElaB/YqjD/DUF883 family membrane-anchored ribosome-binding protein
MENGSQPATKADLGELRGEVEQFRSEVKQEFAQFRSEVKQEFEQVRSEFHHEFDDLRETIRDSQTEILRAFYGYAQTTDVKLKEREAVDVALSQRLTAVESRLLEVEKRLNLPPAA